MLYLYLAISFLLGFASAMTMTAYILPLLIRHKLKSESWQPSPGEMNHYTTETEIKHD